MAETFFGNVFQQLVALLLMAAAIGTFAILLKQPLIVGYILVGILAGPSVLGRVIPREAVDLLAKIGIALLLFVVGLRLDLHLIRTMGRVALATGLGQVIFTSLVGYFLAVALGMEPVAALYVCVALTFSSTIIIVKLLSDKREIDTLHGRIAVGFLIVQDIFVVLVMIGLSAYGFAGASDQLGYTLLLLLLKGAALLAGIALLMRYVLPSLLHYWPVRLNWWSFLPSPGRYSWRSWETRSVSARKWGLSCRHFPGLHPLPGSHRHPAREAAEILMEETCIEESCLRQEEPQATAEEGEGERKDPG